MRIIFLALALGLAAPASAATNLIVNGGFESNFSGWTRSAINDATAINTVNPFEGSRDARLRTDASGELTLSQDIVTNAGYRYELTYWLSNRGNPNPVDSFEVVTGATTESFGDRAAFAYTQFTQQFIGQAGTTNILFRYVHPTPGNFQLDSVSVQVVPEPATWALLISGFALVGAAMRRRKPVVAA